MFFEYPSRDDWEKLVKTLPLEKLRINLSDFEKRGNSPNHFVDSIEIDTWTMHLSHRLADICKSYVMLMYYYNKGIPDDEWYISPGRKGESIQYFPHFEKEHFYAKDQFDYYADMFYYKIFSAWDTIGHVLNVLDDLGIKEKNVSFNLAVKKLEEKNLNLYNNLKELKGDPNFKEAKRLRHDITHNYLPGSVGSGIKRPSNNTITYGVGSYTPSKKIKDNVIKAIGLLVKTLDYIKN